MVMIMQLLIMYVFFKKIYVIIFRFQKHNLQVSKYHKIGCFNLFFTQKKGMLTTYRNTRTEPNQKCSGWVGSSQGVKSQKLTQSNPSLFDWFGYCFPLNSIWPNPCTPLDTITKYGQLMDEALPRQNKKNERKKKYSKVYSKE